MRLVVSRLQQRLPLRFRRMAETHRIHIVGGKSFACRDDERVLLAMERGGADGIEVGCRGGGCGICRVRVVDGEYRTGKMSIAAVSEADRKAGYALACRLFPDGELVIEVE